MSIESLKRDIGDWLYVLGYRISNLWKGPCRWIRHAYQRIRYGVSYKDAWNIDCWISDVVPKILEFLVENTHGYPTCVEELHGKICELEGTPKITISGEDKEFETYNDDLRKIIFLLREYNEETCSIKNQETFITGGNRWDPLDYALTPKEKEQNKRWMNEENRIQTYRMDCLQKGLRMLSVYAPYLWD